MWNTHSWWFFVAPALHKHYFNSCQTDVNLKRLATYAMDDKAFHLANEILFINTMTEDIKSFTLLMAKAMPWRGRSIVLHDA